MKGKYHIRFALLSNSLYAMTHHQSSASAPILLSTTVSCTIIEIASASSASTYISLDEANVAFTEAPLTVGIWRTTKTAKIPVKGQSETFFILILLLRVVDGEIVVVPIAAIL